MARPNLCAMSEKDLANPVIEIYMNTGFGQSPLMEPLRA